MKDVTLGYYGTLSRFVKLHKGVKLDFKVNRVRHFQTGTAVEMGTFREKLAQNETVLRDVLVVNSEFLTLLVRADLLDVAECIEIQDEADSKTKADITLRVLGERTTADTYTRFLQSLNNTKQGELAELLTDVGIDLLDISRVQATLGEQLRDMDEFLSREERRTQVSSQRETVNDQDVVSNTEPTGQKVMQEAITQFDRCKSVISKLHEDCNNVARLNSDILDQVQQCDTKIRENLNYRRRGNNRPRKSQDIFDQLVKDINDLAKRHSRDQAMETEARIPCLRMVRQFNDWVLGRIIGLRSVYNTTDAPKVNFNEAAQNDDDLKHLITELNLKKMGAAGKDPLLDALRQFEYELKRYLNYELHVSEEYRRLRRVRHLQRTSNSYTSRILHETEESLRQLETEDNRAQVQKIRGFLDNMATEYDECVSVLEKYVRYSTNEAEGNESNPVSPKSPKMTPRNKKSKPITSSNGSTTKQTKQSPRRKVSPSPTMLQRIQSLIGRNQELAVEISNLKIKYRSELDRKKREMDSSLKKSKDQNSEMVLKINELEAEKDKFRKLYTATKVSYKQGVQTHPIVHAPRKTENSTPTDTPEDEFLLTQRS